MSLLHQAAFLVGNQLFLPKVYIQFLMAQYLILFKWIIYVMKNSSLNKFGLIEKRLRKKKTTKCEMPINQNIKKYVSVFILWNQLHLSIIGLFLFKLYPFDANKLGYQTFFDSDKNIHILMKKKTTEMLTEQERPLAWTQVLALLLCLLVGESHPHPVPKHRGTLGYTHQLDGGTPINQLVYRWPDGVPPPRLAKLRYIPEMCTDRHLWKQYIPHSFGMRAIKTY